MRVRATDVGREPEKEEAGGKENRNKDGERERERGRETNKREGCKLHCVKQGPKRARVNNANRRRVDKSAANHNANVRYQMGSAKVSETSMKRKMGMKTKQKTTKLMKTKEEMTMKRERDI